MKIVWIQASGAVTDISDFYAIHRIEEVNSLGQRIEELSSLRNPPATVDRPAPNDNILIPLSGLDATEITLVSGEVVTKCLIDADLVRSGITYKLSGRLGSISNSPVVPIDVKTTEDGQNKTTEAGDFKTLE